MAKSAQIKEVRNHHEALLQYMIAHPRASLKELSLIFQMTPAWISTIIHSDAFQVKLAERQDQAFIDVALPLRRKLHGVADAAVDRLGQALHDTQDPRMILDIADKTLHRLGYAPTRNSAPAAPVHQSNTQLNLYGTVDADTLSRARGLLKQQQSGELPAPASPALEVVGDEPEAD